MCGPTVDISSLGEVEEAYEMVRTRKSSAKRAVRYRVAARDSLGVMANGNTPIHTVTTGTACRVPVKSACSQSLQPFRSPVLSHMSAILSLPEEGVFSDDQPQQIHSSEHAATEHRLLAIQIDLQAPSPKGFLCGSQFACSWI